MRILEHLELSLVQLGRDLIDDGLQLQEAHARGDGHERYAETHRLELRIERVDIDIRRIARNLDNQDVFNEAHHERLFHAGHRLDALYLGRVEVFRDLEPRFALEPKGVPHGELLQPCAQSLVLGLELTARPPLFIHTALWIREMPPISETSNTTSNCPCTATS